MQKPDTSFLSMIQKFHFISNHFVEVEPFISGLGSYWDFPSMMGAAAAWFVWQNFLVRFHIPIIQSRMMSGRLSE